MTARSRLAEPSDQRTEPYHRDRRLGALLHAQTQILREMAAGQPAQCLAEHLCVLIQRLASGRIAILMRLGADRQMRLFAAPGVSPALVAALDEPTLGRWSALWAAGIHEAAPILVADASRDPRWAEQHALTATHNIRAWWSYPVQQDGRTLGTFTLCGPTSGLPSRVMSRLLEQTVAIAGSILQLMDLQDTQRLQTERMRRLTGFNTMLAQVNQLAATKPDHGALYDGICRIAVLQADLRLAWVAAPDRTGRFQALAAAGATAFLGEIMVSADPTLPKGQGLAGTAWREGRTMVGQGFSTEPILGPWAEAAHRFGLGAGAALPLMLHGRTVALLLVYTREEGVLDPELVGVLEELAVDVGRALEALDQQRHLDRLQALHTALLTEGEVLLRARSDDEMLNRTCEHLAEGGLFHIAWIARPDTAGVMQALASAGPGMALLADQRFALDDAPPSLVVRGWREGRVVVRNDLLNEPDLARYRDLLDQANWRSAAVVPVRRGGSLFAVLVLGSSQSGLFAPDVLALCERIAELLGHGLDELDLKQTLEDERRQQFYLARHDELTGLPNRRQFEGHIGPAMARARRRDTPLAICMLDIDDFKPINDRFGHAAGDSLLRQAAKRMREALRRSDLIARLGGDEFVLAIDGFGRFEALLGRLLKAMEAPFDLGAEGVTVRVGLSAGVAVFPEDGDGPDLLLRRADAALYAAKAHKASRGHNWLRWSEEIAQYAAPSSEIVAPYGPEALRLLGATEGIWPAVAAEFLESFYISLAGQKLAAPILAALSPAELTRLKARQAEHLIALMAPTTDRETMCRTARVVGQVHALVGVDNVLMVQAIGFYQARLTERLAALPLRPIDRRSLVAVATARLQEDNAEQMEASAKTIGAYFDVLLQRLPRSDIPWVDAAQVQLDALAGLPGILAAGLLRPDAEGKFQVLASSSAVGLYFPHIHEASGTVPIIATARPEGRGLIAEAWLSGEIVTAASYQTDPLTVTWHEAARRFGIRSGVALSVRDTEDNPIAVLVLLGAYPSQFEAMWMRHVCVGMAQGLALLWQQRRATVTAVVVPEIMATAWRKRLFAAGGLLMHYQPIVDLRTGRPWKAEALARLVLEDGQVIAPTQFLPVLRAQDLDELFRVGLAEALGQVARWELEGLSLGVTINLAPTTLARPDCAFWVHDALRQTRVAPERLFLEITEDQPFNATADNFAAIAGLARLGVNLVMDDLGAGYGSLHRLRTLPFRAVKLDQGMVRDVRHSPVRALSFVGALVQLGHDLEIEVVVEGLESDDLVEAAAVLGADAGQGFALGHPMPAEAIPGWARDFVMTVDRTAPRTPLGALATMWRGTHVSGDRQELAEASPMTRFLEAYGLTGEKLGATHRALRALAAEEGQNGSRYRAALRQFQMDLVGIVTGSA